MSSEHLRKVGELFDASLEMDPQQRSEFLKRACGTDQALIVEVESLVAAHHQAGNFIETPAFASITKVVFNQEKLIADGAKIGAYRIVREIGRGGMGAVYLAERADEQFKKYVAIKILERGMDRNVLVRYFRGERQILASFDHPNIARVFDGGSTESGLPYFVMEYVEGKAIDEYCDEQNLSITRRLDLFQQVCAAVSYAHRHSVIHRDIKPSNIFVTKDGVPKLLDFGIAKILQTEGEVEATVTATNFMTPEFASPEQAQGLSVTTLSDVYSLGVVLYELLTGHFPYELKSRAPLEIARAISTTQPQKPSTIISNLRNTESPLRTPEIVSKCREGTPERLRKRLSGDLDNIVLMALRKEPQRRYQSVEQFSEDIKRHLDGLPVAARKDTIGYRASKFVGRNKLTTAAASFAFIAILIGGLIQWRANQQAKFLQDFGQEAARMEGIMRFSYLLPLHDTTAERDKVIKRIQDIESRMARLGRNAQGPGHYAIARGWMALHRYDDARKNFEIAINKNGYLTPEVAYSYGLTLAMIYQTELDFAQRIASKEQLEIRKNEIKKEFKEPALSYIQQGNKSADYSEYAQAMVDFLDERYEKAIQKSQQAIQKNPWMYEALQLEGESHRKIGRDHFNKGDFSQALNSYKKAQTAFTNSIQRGTSDPLSYLGSCLLQRDMINLLHHSGEPGAKESYLEGKEACSNASKAAPGNAEVYLALASLQERLAMKLSPHKDTFPVLEEAVHAAEQAVALLPEDPKTHRTLGSVHMRFTDYYYNNLQDPRKELELGDRSLQKAIELNPNDSDAYSLRGQMFVSYAHYLIETGKDPLPSLNKSYELMQKAISINPKIAFYYLALGQTLATKAEYENEVGLDLTESVNTSVNALKKAIEMNPKSVNAYLDLGWVCTTKAEYLVTAGKNPMDALGQAEKTYREAIQIRPDVNWSHRGLGQIFWIKAEYSIDSQKDPTSYIKEAKLALSKAIGEDPTNWYRYAIEGELEITAGRWKMLQQQSPESEFQRAKDLFKQATKLGPEQTFFDVWYSQARLFRRWAEWKLKSNQSAEKEIRTGQQMVTEALELNPRSAEMIGTRGIFWLMQARSISDVSQKKALIRKASDSFKEAIKMNPNFSHLFHPFLNEASSL
jgi:serine/threonine protein kinase